MKGKQEEQLIFVLFFFSFFFFCINVMYFHTLSELIQASVL